MELRIDPAAEQAILSALRAGDIRQAARLMVQYHGVAVYESCCSMVGDVEEAEDLTQSVFARAFALLAGFRGELNSRQWLLEVGRRRCEEYLEASPRRAGSTEATGIGESLRRRLEVLASAV